MLMRNSKLKHFRNYFHENKLNLLKTWEVIRKFTNISKKGKADITSIQIDNTTIKKFSEIANEFNKYFIFFAKQRKEKLVFKN